jgi:SpoVK/Ycf46/Vps4 family AAA+-type ATPase
LASDAFLCALKRKIAGIEAQFAVLTRIATATTVSSSGEGKEEKHPSTGGVVPPSPATTKDGHEMPTTLRGYLASMSEAELRVSVCHDDFLQAVSSLTPSLSREELAHYANLQKQFSARSVAPDSSSKKR